MTIGERLLKLRRDKNISQEELANELDVSRQTVSKWETDQSLPDSDKIIPLCEYFGITSDELLTGNSNIKEAKQDNVKSNFARNIAVAITLYILAIPTLIISAAQFEQPIVGITLFFVLIAAATGILIYNGIYYSKKSEAPKKEKEDTVKKQVLSIVDILIVTVYLIISFMTGAWAVTWLIFLIGGVVREIVKLIMTLNTKKEERSDIDE